jgi:hypothetical protein
MSKPSASHTFSLPKTFSSLRKLWLFNCSIQDGTFLASLQQCTQLKELALVECHMHPTEVLALSSLCVLSALQQLMWEQPRGQTSADVTLGALAQLTQLTSLSLAYNKHATDKAAMSTLMTVPSKMKRLQAFEIASALSTVAGNSTGTTNLKNLVWDRLDSEDLKQHLTNYSMLTSLKLRNVVLDQAGLDLLLAQRHIVHVALLAVAATESRVDSPCSWETLVLGGHVDIRTLAYVPLHSLKKPLAIGSLLLPPDVRTEQLPDLLHKAAGQLAANLKQVALRTPGLVGISDLLDHSHHLVPTFSKRVWTPDILQALFQALAPLAACAGITGEGTTIR